MVQKSWEASLVQGKPVAVVVDRRRNMMRKALAAGPDHFPTPTDRIDWRRATPVPLPTAPLPPKKRSRLKVAIVVFILLALITMLPVIAHFLRGK